MEETEKLETEGSQEYINSFSEIKELPLSSVEVGDETEEDLILLKIIHMVQHGWPNSPVGEEFKPYFKRRFELSVEGK